jgi:hypothetical protein
MDFSICVSPASCPAGDCFLAPAGLGDFFPPADFGFSPLPVPPAVCVDGYDLNRW